VSGEPDGRAALARRGLASFREVDRHEHAARGLLWRSGECPSSGPEEATMPYPVEKMKNVYTIVERKTGKNFWLRIGVGFVNSDGSITLRLNALPTNSQLMIRDYQRDWPGRPGDSEQEPEHEGAIEAAPAPLELDPFGAAQ
jgi:hypothetical protein